MKNSRHIGTYRAALSALVAAAGTAPFFVISGVAGRKIKITRVLVSGLTLTAVAYLSIVASKYSTAPTGGTPVAATKVPLSSAFEAAAATLVQGYTAAPTAGTLVGEVSNLRILGQSTTAAAAGIPTVNEIGWSNEGEEPVLLSAAENVALRFSAAPASAVTLNITVEWEEETF
jgi:hypothetical protein